MKKLNRRQFIKNSGLATIVGVGGVQVGIGRSLLKGAGSSQSKDLLVYVFLEGGMDGLNLIPPKSGADYAEYTALRPTLHIPDTQSIALNGSTTFGMHPSATAFAGLFNQGKVAIIHATGMSEANRSHFASTAMLELGTQNSSVILGSGWLTRYFNSSLSTPDDAVIPSVVTDYNPTDAFLGDPSALVMGEPSEFSLNLGHWSWVESMQSTLSEMYQIPTTTAEVVAHQTLSSSNIVQNIDWLNYVPGNGAVYPVGYFGDQAQTVAQLFKENVDLEVAYIPYGGWDTHVGQGTGTEGDFADLVQGLSEGLNALYQDLAATHAGKFTIIVQSEFGRRSYENNDAGTDHGYGNPMFVIGDDVNGGFHGQFPGLAANQLFEEQDVDVNIDYRDVVSEVLMKRMQNRFLGYIFPEYTNYNPVGVVNGADLTPVYDFDYDPIFKSGFE